MSIRRIVSGVVVGSLCLGGLGHVPAIAAGQELVINEVYTRGGSPNQPYATKYVELHNPTTSPRDLGDYGLSYSPAGQSGIGQATCVLAGTIPANGYFLIGVGSNGGAGAALTTDQTCTGINPSGTSGSYTLLRNSDSVDVVGWGRAQRFEKAPAPYPGRNSTPGSITRTNGADTDNNAADFVFVTVPTPQNTGTSPAPNPPASRRVSIADIQGAGSTTPLAEQPVTTIGVVTAVYPTGGFNGVYLQTPGTGGKRKSADEASDGIFVHSAEAATTLAIGDCVEVSGTASEFHGLTQIGGTVSTTPVTGCQPVTGTEFPGLPATDAEKEAYEGMLVQPTGNYTITNNYQLNQYGQVGLASGVTPLYHATAVVAPGQEATDYEAANLARYITLDDGSSWDYLRNQTAQSSPLPYLSQNTPMRTGAPVTFSKPVILDFRHQWNFQPTGHVVGARDEDNPVTSPNDREQNPPEVGGKLKIASFNVLNYFTDLGVHESGCRAYHDRAGQPVTTNRCQVRGAFSESAFKDQQAKIVTAINTLNADVVALMEVENSAGLSYISHDRDASLAALVDSLNAGAGRNRWAYVPSPTVHPPNEDVIRTALIYNPAKVALTGQSQILLDGAFANARYPLAQQFTADGKTFVVVANHFKSKGSGADDGTGQGLSNPSREAQARALTGWVSATFSDLPVFLTGDFNAYTRETPLQIIERAGYTNVVKKHEPTSASYQFGGRLGSLDHIFANQPAMAMVTGGAVWDINGDESVAMEYSRRNYNVVDFYAATPFRSSDHDPVLIGLSSAPNTSPSPGTPSPQPSATQSAPAQSAPAQPSPAMPTAPTSRPLPSTGAESAGLFFAVSAAMLAAFAHYRRHR